MASGQIVTTCPHCQKQLKADESSIGRQVRCSQCRESFRITTVAFGSSASMSVQADDHGSVTSDSLSEWGDGTSRRAAAADPTIAQVGRFELKTLLGVGGFGKVYRAYDPVLDRDVALKVPRFEGTENRKIRRFLTEAKAAAALRHPNIVALFESGRADGRYFIATEYVEGRPLSDHLKQGGLERIKATRLVRSLAEALHYAHSEGIVHRDIKPENVMIDVHGRPQIMDFGLAKRVEEDSSVTTDGSLLGTPAYMAPEQARGELSKVGPASDQYSLAVVLYELLTGQKPFDGPPHVVIAKVIGEDPPGPRTIDDTIPVDLEAICLKALEKESDRRYDDAQRMADDLGRWLDGYETLARPIGRLERVRRWAGRNRLVAGLGFALMVMFALGFAGVSWQGLRAQRALALVEPERRRANEKAVAAQKALAALQVEKERVEEYATQLSDALARIEPETRRANENAANAKAALDRADAERAKAIHNQLVGEVTLARTLCEQNRISDGLLWYAHALHQLDAVGEQERYALDHLIRTELANWRPHLHRPRFVLPHPRQVTDVAFSPDGQSIATACHDRAVRLFETTTGTSKQKPWEHSARVVRLAFNSDGTVLVSGCSDGSVFRWNVSSGDLIGRPLSHPQEIKDLAMTPADEYLIVATQDIVYYYKFDPLQIVRRIKGVDLGGHDPTAGHVREIALTPDGKECYVVTARTVGKFMIPSGRIVKPLSDDWHAALVAMTHNGRLLASASHHLRLWDPETSREVPSPIVPVGKTVDIEFSPDDTLIATGTEDGMVRLSSVDNGRQVGQTLHTDKLRAIAFSPTEPLLASAGGRNDGVWVWEVAEGAKPAAAVRFETEDKIRPTMLVRPDGDGVFAAANDGSVRVFDLKTGQPRTAQIGYSSRVRSISLHPHGRLLAIGGDSGLVISAWPPGRTSARTVQNEGPLYAVGFLDQGAQIYAAGNNSVQFWDTETLKPSPLRITHPNVVQAVAVDSSVGKVFCTASKDVVRVWDLTDGSEICPPVRFRSIARDHAHDYPRADDVAFAPNGSYFVAGRDQLFIRLRHAKTGQPAPELPGLPQTGIMMSAEFSPDSELLATGSVTGHLMLWDTGTGRPIGPMRKHVPRPIYNISFIDAGQQAVAIYAEAYVAVWDVPSPRTGTPQELSERVAVETRMELSSDQTIRTLGSTEWMDRVRRLNVANHQQHP